MADGSREANAEMKLWMDANGEYYKGRFECGWKCLVVVCPGRSHNAHNRKSYFVLI